MVKIIGVSGFARSGKDTFFNIISQFNPLMERVAFADLLKDEVKDAVREKYDLDVYSQVTSEKNIFRPMLIEHGAGMRKVDPEYWLKSGMSKAEEVQKRGFIPVITDVRYLNEAKAIIDNGGIVISLHRLGTLPAHKEEETSIAEVLDFEHSSIFDYEWNQDIYNERGEIIVDLDELRSVYSFLERCIRDSQISHESENLQ